MLLLLLACAKGGDDTSTSDDTSVVVDDTQIQETGGDPCADNPIVPLAELAPVESCPELTQGLVPVERAGFPYLLSHPKAEQQEGPVTTIVLLAGGPGDLMSSESNASGFLMGDQAFGSVRLVVPYVDETVTDRGQSALQALEEVQRCFETGTVHLMGHSSGGYVAYDLMAESPGPFTTLTGFPGLFGDPTDQALTESLQCRAVLNGVGAEDSGWRTEVESTHARLEGLGVESELLVVEGMGHVPDPSFDASLLFGYWAAHP